MSLTDIVLSVKFLGIVDGINIYYNYSPMGMMIERLKSKLIRHILETEINEGTIGEKLTIVIFFVYKNTIIKYYHYHINDTNEYITNDLFTRAIDNFNLEETSKYSILLNRSAEIDNIVKTTIIVSNKIKEDLAMIKQICKN